MILPISSLVLYSIQFWRILINTDKILKTKQSMTNQKCSGLIINLSNNQFKQSQLQQIKKIKENKMIKEEEQNKQFKQYKDFTTLTNLRKVTQETFNPIIQSLEEKISTMLEGHDQMSKKMIKLEELLTSQNVIKARIQSIDKSLQTHKQIQSNQRHQDEKRAGRLDNANQKLFLQVHSLKTMIDGQNQIIKQISNRSNKTHEMYTALTSNNNIIVKQMQQKYLNFSKQVLTLTKTLKDQHVKLQSETESAKESFKMQRQSIMQKMKPLDLYLSERVALNEKMEDLYQKIIFSVTKDDFQSYRKGQKALMNEKMDQITKQLDILLPASLRAQLPVIQKKLKQVERIKDIQSQCVGLQLEIGHTNKKIEQNNEAFLEKIQILENETKKQNSNLEQLLEMKLKQIQQKQHNASIQFEQKIQKAKTSIQEQMQEAIQRQTSSLFKSIQQEIKSNGSKNKLPDFSSKSQEMKKQVQQVRDIRQKMLARYNKIQELGKIIDTKIESYSNKITRIKSDYELFAENMRKQVSGVIRFRDTFIDRLQDVGKIVSSFTEALLINTSLILQNSQEQIISNPHTLEDIEPIVFVTENDGIIYEWKPESPNGTIIYRRQKFQAKQFLRSYMYSLISFLDDQFTSSQFLNWKQQKPSCFFKDRVQYNYNASFKRVSQSRNITTRAQSRSFNRAPSLSNGNQNLIEELQKKKIHTANNLNSKTLESKAKIENMLEQGNNITGLSEQNRKNYSIKKSKACSGNIKSGEKSINDASRYDQIFLTSRSACRSRISQLI